MNKFLRVITFLFLDLIFISASWLLAIVVLRYDMDVIFEEAWYFFVASVLLSIVFNALFRMYSKLWRYAGISDALKLIGSVLCSTAVLVVAAIVTENLTKEWVIICAFIYFLLFGGSRFMLRSAVLLERAEKSRRGRAKQKRIMIIGAGETGFKLVKEMKFSDKMDYNPVCLLDDATWKIGQEVHGVKVVGKCDDAVKMVAKYEVDEIIIAIPSATKKQLKEIMDKCSGADVPIKIVPKMYNITDGKMNLSDIKKVSITDLLGREQIKVNLDEIMGYIEGKVVLVTGGGGSIGSELCRQIARYKPKELIIVDIYENNAYAIEQELLRAYKDELNLTVRIASVRDENKMDMLFAQFKPNLVFHAAAHKHVPLMENSPNEAVKNNVVGTYNVADVAGRYNVEKFILISTDKAVNPTNIMGATKRICEMIVQAMDKKYQTDYVAVRFGNVLGSNGSVVPLFEKQIAEGGPVTVTHKDIVRYFMTIPEAVSLVLQAGAYATGGEIFVLDMGDQVRIYDLAEKMIRLSGLEPFEDIEIKITGLRPGEKLYEERLMEEEGLTKTANEMISIGKPLEVKKNLFAKIAKLKKLAYEETDNMKELVHELVPTYTIDKREIK